MASLSVSSTSDSSIRVRLSGLDGSYSGDRTYYWYIDGQYDGSNSSSGSTTSKTWTFTGLEPDTEYEIECEVEWYTDDGEGDVQYSYFSVTAQTDPLEITAYYSITSLTKTGITIKVYDLVSGYTVRFYVVDNDTEEYVVDKAYTATGSTMTKSFSGLSPGTEYRVNVEINNSYLCGVQYVTTPLPDYSFDIIIPTDTTVGAVVYEVSSGDTVRVYIRKASSSTAVVHDKAYTATGSPFEITNIGGLTPNTEYTMNISINGGDWLGAQAFKTAKGRPDDWEWWSVVGKGEKIKLSASEWKAFTERINEFRVYTGLAEDSFIEVVSGLTKISAAVANQARSSIAEIPGHGTLPASAVTGAPITASFFNGLESALNYVE